MVTHTPYLKVPAPLSQGPSRKIFSPRFSGQVTLRLNIALLPRASASLGHVVGKTE